MQLFYQILEIVNYVAIGITSIGFLLQIVMIIFFFLKEKRFKEAQKQHKIGILICAWNEEKVIGNTVRHLLSDLDYPKELYEVFVIADNCTDLTAEKAKEAGATVYIHHNPNHHNHGWALHDGVDLLLKERDDFDFFIFLDADNHLEKHYLHKMNNAFESGVRIARPFEASLNGNQNTWSAISACYYVRDSRIASNFRERIHSDSMLCTPGMMVDAALLQEHGFDATSNSEDVEYTIKSLKRGEKVHYVAEAIVYEDQPTTSKDTWNRLIRMGNGIHKLFWTQGWGFLFDFFKHPRFSRIDLFLQIMIIPVDVICFVWFPIYYIYYILLHLFNGFGPNPGFLGFIDAQGSYAILTSLALMILVVVSFYFVIYIFQTGIAVILSKKKLGVTNLKGYKRGIFLSPLFMIYYAFAIIFGIFTNAGWKQINRNDVK